MTSFDDDPDATLVTAAVAGDRTAFAALLERHYDRIHRLAGQITGSRADAEDVAQEVCCTLAEKIGSFRADAKFTTWLCGITLNSSRDVVRRRRSFGRLRERFAILAALSEGPDGRDLHDAIWLRSAITRLKQAYRETVVLVIGQELSHAEAAAILGVSESTVSWRLYEVAGRLGPPATINAKKNIDPASMISRPSGVRGTGGQSSPAVGRRRPMSRPHSFVVAGSFAMLLSACATSGPSAPEVAGAEEAGNIVVTGSRTDGRRASIGEAASLDMVAPPPPPPPAFAAAAPAMASVRASAPHPMPHYRNVGRDKFASAAQNPFKAVREEPVSTFSIDVDTTSYSFVRASLNRNVLPQPAAVRAEEMINYFPYRYPAPTSATQPFRSAINVMPSPFTAGRKLVRIGIRGYAIKRAARPQANLVFLIDTSGSMNEPNKLPLVRQSLAMLIDQLDGNDRVAIVTFSGSAGTALEPTPASQKGKIRAVLDRLGERGSTAGAEGIRQAYALAAQNFDPKGVNRVIIATDGDFNVGITNQDELKGFVERKRGKGAARHGRVRRPGRGPERLSLAIRTTDADAPFVGCRVRYLPQCRRDGDDDQSDRGGSGRSIWGHGGGASRPEPRRGRPSAGRSGRDCASAPPCRRSSAGDRRHRLRGARRPATTTTAASTGSRRRARRGSGSRRSRGARGGLWQHRRHRIAGGAPPAGARAAGGAGDVGARGLERLHRRGPRALAREMPTGGGRRASDVCRGAVRQLERRPGSRAGRVQHRRPARTQLRPGLS